MKKTSLKTRKDYVKRLMAVTDALASEGENPAIIIGALTEATVTTAQKLFHPAVATDVLDNAAHFFKFEADWSAKRAGLGKYRRAAKLDIKAPVPSRRKKATR